MKRPFFCLLAASALGLVALGGPAAADSLVIELPWLVTTFSPVAAPPDGGLFLPANVAHVASATLRLEGTATPGLINCDLGSPDPTYDPAPVDVEIFAYNPCTSALGGWWRASLSGLEGAVALDVPLLWQGMGLTTPPVDWSCWLGDQVLVEMAWAYALVGLCGFETTPTLEVTRATLVLQVDFTVGAEQRSWGGIKALYE